MKGEQQEERIPNFIGNAVIILTAAHLGCEVEMLATAQEVWRTKRLPEAVLLGMYEKAACDAVSAVRKRGLAEQADRLGEIFYRTGEFPPPVGLDAECQQIVRLGNEVQPFFDGCQKFAFLQD